MSLQARGNVDPGQLDRLVKLYFASATRDAAGGQSSSWTQFAEVWASKVPTRGGRMYAADQKHNEAVVVFRIRHRADVAAFQRLVDGDATYEILQPEEAGRSHYMDLPCRAIDQNTAVKRTRTAA